MFQPLLPTDLQPISNARDLVSRLAIILASLLGTYVTKNPADPPQSAIWLVVDESIDPPKNYIARGLEVLVYEPHLNSSALGHNAIAAENYRIRLIQHDRGKRCTAAHESILAHFPDCQKSTLSLANRDGHEELVLTVSQSKIIR